MKKSIISPVFYFWENSGEQKLVVDEANAPIKSGACFLAGGFNHMI